MAEPISKDALDQIFMAARTHYKWQNKPVSEALLRQLVEVVKMGPTSANQSPARFIFLTSDAAKKRLEPLLSETNRAKTMSAPAVAIIGYDSRFYEALPKLFPHADAKSWFAGKPDAVIETSAFRNGTLQGGYFIIAARALGLDTGPMSGFDNAGVDKEFFAGTSVKSNFICNLGYGDDTGLFPRLPRFSFEEIAKII